MVFVAKRNKNFKEPMDDIEYLNRIGVIYISGKVLGNLIGKIIVDESKNAYLICTGMTHPNRDGGDIPIYYYSFCKDEKVFKLEVVKNNSENPKNFNIVNYWTATIKEVPKDIIWSQCKSEICKMIKEALSVDAYSRYSERVKKECFKSVEIDIVC